MADDKKPAPDARKKWGKRLFVGGIVLLVVAVVGIPKKKEGGVVVTSAVYHPPSRAQEVNFPFPKAEPAKGFPRKYTPRVYDFSDMTEKSPPQVVPYPGPGEEYVSVILPVNHYVVKKFPSTKVKYDYGVGYAPVIDEPDVEIPAKNVPPAFDMQGVEEGGTLTIRCYLKPGDWAATKNVSSNTALRVKGGKKKAHAARKKDLPTSDIPSRPQII